jgi:hypothetical protein
MTKDPDSTRKGFVRDVTTPVLSDSPDFKSNLEIALSCSASFWSFVRFQLGTFSHKTHVLAMRSNVVVNA